MALNQGILIVQKVETMPELIIPDFDAERHVYTLAGKVLPSVTQILRLLLEASRYTDESRVRGHAVHLACQLYDEDDLDMASVDASILPYLDAYINYRLDSAYEPDLIEQPLADKAHSFCGTPDRVTWGRSVEDIKSGAYEPWHALQLAGYAYLLPEPMSVERRAVYLADDGKYTLRVFPKADLWADWNVFQSALNLFNWKARNR